MILMLVHRFICGHSCGHILTSIHILRGQELWPRLPPQAFACGAVGTVVGSILAFWLVGRWMGPAGWQLAACLAASYVVRAAAAAAAAAYSSPPPLLPPSPPLLLPPPPCPQPFPPDYA